MCEPAKRFLDSFADYSSMLSNPIYIYIYVCVGVCVGYYIKRAALGQI